ncbi:aminotransferase class I/II-fold pyridoxal phosphate-dependent enzyme [Solwaraspora sp. WMMD406]|uniref:DegT/DnrJ/EryC1/StrS family aminotransferase n=1 Tax=Solwaraspora sp. WMMD406 TaxID=3016095 RepID=UPI002416860E|nr:aminotransferase class I/II-fold pyridoxal phosphate-dependent enzyme [Solwaraspora sp. WMMD406]MDG4766077.1 aminotransferase class I/II-fold pyridoxal phosphate-dependent enzyme [Solwaraspora sp. WMMD406]
MTEQIYLSSPDVGALEEEYLVTAIRSGWVAPSGPDVDAFERELAARTGVDHAVALNSATAGLHLALLALGVGPGQSVVVPTLTFVATANAVAYTGAEPVFVDCDERTGNIDVDLLAALLARTDRRWPPVRAVIPVDMFGRCADYHTLLPVCAAYGIPVVEDAAEALGASLAGRPAGSFGHVGVFSFNGNKIMTTSGGGMVVTDDENLASRCRHLAAQARQPVAHYEHAEVGYNYRLSNLLAALGRAQLRRLDSMVARRRELRARYAKAFAGVPGVRLLGDDGDAADLGGNCWLTVIVVDPARSGWTAAALGDYLTRRHIETRPVWKPMHRQPVFATAHRMLTGAADRLFANGLALPSGSALGDEQMSRVLAAIHRFVDGDRALR